jgi:vacuolar protein sorting-associated protein 45
VSGVGLGDHRFAFFKEATVSLISSQSEILKKDVYLIEKIEKESQEKMLHLKAIYIIRPTDKNIAYLAKEVKDPKFSEYFICNCSF